MKCQVCGGEQVDKNVVSISRLKAWLHTPILGQQPRFVVQTCGSPSCLAVARQKLGQSA